MTRSNLSLDFEWLEDFIEVAKTGNFTQAAMARGISQPTLTRRISNLESWLEAELFNREAVGSSRVSHDAREPRRSPISLTDAGEEFWRRANDIVLKVREAKDRAQQISPKNSLRIYTLHTLAATFAPLVIGAIRDKAPRDEFEIKISVAVGTISECVEAVSYGAVPFMISYENPKHKILFPGDVPPDRITSMRIAKDELIPICPGGDKSKEYADMIKAGKPVPFLAYSEGTYLSHLVREKIQELQINVNQIDDAQMADTLRNLARRGQGMAWVLRTTAENALGKKEIDEVRFPKGVSASIPLDIILFRSAAYSPKHDELITIERVWKASRGLEESFRRGAA